MWNRLMTHLEQFAQPNMPGIDVKRGISAEEGGESVTPNYPAVRICRGGEKNVDLLTKGKGSTYIWLETMVESDDQDPGVAYDIMEQIENQLYAVIREWVPQAQRDLRIKMDVSIPDVYADGEVYRPVVRARHVLLINWNK